MSVCAVASQFPFHEDMVGYYTSKRGGGEINLERDVKNTNWHIYNFVTRILLFLREVLLVLVIFLYKYQINTYFDVYIPMTTENIPHDNSPSFCSAPSPPTRVSISLTPPGSPSGMWLVDSGTGGAPLMEYTTLHCWLRYPLSWSRCPFTCTLLKNGLEIQFKQWTGQATIYCSGAQVIKYSNKIKKEN